MRFFDKSLILSVFLIWKSALAFSTTTAPPWRQESTLRLQRASVNNRSTSYEGGDQINPPPTLESEGSTSDASTTMEQQPKLSLEAVGQRAASVEGCKQVPTSSSNFAIFLVGVSDQCEADRLARITVFADTGTVVSSRVDAWGQVRHVFRRHVSSLDEVERLLRQPPQMTAIDHTLVGLVDDDDDDGDDNAANENGPPGNGNRSTPSLSSELELCEVGLVILEGEKAKLEQHLTSLQQQQSQPQTHHQLQQQQQLPVSPQSPQHSQTSSSVNPQTPAAAVVWKDIGMEFQFSLSAASMKHVDQCMHDITSMNKLIRGVATNGRGTVFLYGNGGVAYTPNIPRPLHQKLSQLRSNSRMSSRPSYVALGSKDRYFVAFHDGTFSCKGPKSLDRELKKLAQPPLSVAFGPTWDAWFVVVHDGSWKFQGRIPQELSDKLASRNDRGDLVLVTLGPSGEWFLKAKNGRMWWGGLTDAADAAILQLLREHELCMIDFGDDGSYFVSYD